VAGAEPAAQEAAQSAVDAEAIAAEDASLAEEEDALKLDLTQEGEDELRPDASEDEGSGLIRDEVAEEQLAEFTETGGEFETEGGEALEPGREDTSETLAAHHPKTGAAEQDAIGEGNVEVNVDGPNTDEEGGA
jgi:N utilization substance protein A